MEKKLLEDLIENAILRKNMVEITYQVRQHKIVQQKGIIKDLFYQNHNAMVLLETGLPIMFKDIRGIEFSVA